MLYVEQTPTIHFGAKLQTSVYNSSEERPCTFQKNVRKAKKPRVGMRAFLFQRAVPIKNNRNKQAREPRDTTS